MAALLTLLAVAATAAAASPRWAYFTVANFSASANYQNNMNYHADFGYGDTISSSCQAGSNGYADRCQVAGGPYPFVWSRCSGLGGCTAAPPGWSWQLKTGAYDTVHNKTGFNIEVEYDHDPYVGKVYGCKFFSYDQLVCDNSRLGPPYETGNWLAVPPSFSIPAQTASACQYDTTTSSKPATAAATGTARP